MIVLIRLYPNNNAEPIWDFVKTKMFSREVIKVRPMLASLQEDAKWVTIYLMSDDIEAVGDFIVRDLGECKDIKYTMTVPLLKMVFLPVPKELSEKSKRYSIMLRCRLGHYYSAFKKATDIRPDPGINVAFSAFLLGKYDVLLSIISDSREGVDKFVEEKLKAIDGVEEVEVYPIEKSWIVTSDDDWKRLQRTLLYIPTWMTHMGDDMEFAFYLTEEDVSLSGMIR